MQTKLALETYKQPTELVSFEITSFIFNFYNHIWNQHQLDQVPSYYAEEGVLYNDEEFTTTAEINAEIIKTLVDIGANSILIDSVTCNQRGESNNWDVTANWNTALLSEGGNAILGTTHFQICNTKIVRETITFTKGFLKDSSL
ncbi:hypothetical protein [Priestia megaterium]|uniref:hypothetical protein n=1 Tax=Priestia megaterium TaxID=1404 RepID=UPI00366FCF7F